MKKYISKYGEIALLLLVLGAISYDIYLLFRYPVGVGYDGYYYVLQITNLKQHGHLYYLNSYPAILYLLTSLDYLINNPIISTKIGGLLLHITLCASTALIIYELTKLVYLCILGSMLLAFSKMHLYYLSDHISNLGGLSFLLLGLYFGLLWLRNRKKRFAFAFFIFTTVAILSHKAIFFILFILIIFAVLIRIVFQFPYPKQRLVAFSIIIVGLLLVPVIVKSVYSVTQYIDINKEILNIPQWPIKNYNIVWYIVLLAPLLFGLMLSIKIILGGKVNISQLLFIIIVMITVVITLNPFLNHKLGMINVTGRLFSMSYIQIAFLIPGVIWLSNAYKKYLYSGAVIIILLLIYNEVFDIKPIGLSKEFIVNRISLLEALPKIHSKLPKNTMIIANHGDEFMVTSVLGVQSQQRFPQSIENREIYWLLSKTPSRLLSDNNSIIASNDGVNGIILCKYNHLKELLLKLNRDERWEFFNHNSHLWWIITIKR